MGSFEIKTFKKVLLRKNHYALGAKGIVIMHLSDQSVSLISDLLNMRLGDMLVSGREDLSEVIALRRALAEVHGLDPVACGLLKNNSAISHRGRRRKVSEMIAEHVSDGH